MAYRFKHDETFEAGFLRIGLEQIDKARACLAGGGDQQGAIHSSRKALKRIRSLLKLCRSALPKEVFATHNRRFRDIARGLGPARDAQVMLETIAGLQANQRGNSTDAGAFAAVHFLLARNLVEHPASSDPAAISRAIAELDRARGEFETLHFVAPGFEPMAEGLARTYKQGRRAFREVIANPVVNAEHEWRKDVQLHWRHMQLLSNSWPDMCAARVEMARELSRLLGEDHDLEIVARFVAAQPKARLSSTHQKALRTVAIARQKNLREIAFARGEVLFADKPSQLSGRFARYWHAGHQMSELGASGRNLQRIARTGSQDRTR